MLRKVVGVLLVAIVATAAAQDDAEAEEQEEDFAQLIAYKSLTLENNLMVLSKNFTLTYYVYNVGTKCVVLWRRSCRVRVIAAAWVVRAGCFVLLVASCCFASAQGLWLWRVAARRRHVVSAVAFFRWRCFFSAARCCYRAARQSSHRHCFLSLGLHGQPLCSLPLCW
jgi:hypothetical protein